MFRFLFIGLMLCASPVLVADQLGTSREAAEQGTAQAQAIPSAMDEWRKLLLVAIVGGLIGGLIPKILEICYQWWRGRSESSASAKQFVDQHLDPLLKAADELAGKLLSLAREDFKSLRDLDSGLNSVNGRIKNNDFTSLIFLIAKLWANIEIIRRQGLSVSMVKDERGQLLQNFMDCIESRRVRIVDRISQRAVGELMLTNRSDGPYETILFIEFVQLIESNPEAQRWLSPLMRILSRTRHTLERQRLLQYGTVIHAMIDTLDPDHEVTRKRPAYANKLSKKSWRDLKYRVFGCYLTFVLNPEEYLGSPKKRVAE